MNVAQFVVSELIRLGVKRVYTLPGGFSMHINDAVSHSALQPVYCMNESGAAFAACGEAAYTGKLAVCVVTSGPGSTNALTGCASAWLDSLPVLFISGDARSNLFIARTKYGLREAGPQDVDIFPMVKPITKSSYWLHYAELTSQFIMDSYLAAMQPRRGPVWMDVPLDVQTMEAK